MEDLTLIKFKVTDNLFGYPYPYIPNGSIVILIQDGRAQFSLYNEATEDFPSPSFIHPKEPDKNIVLELEAVELIKRECPQYLTSDVSIVLTCPIRIAEKIIW